MILVPYLVLFVSTLAFVSYLKKKSKDCSNLPPGPVGLPILGYLPFLDVFHLGQSFKQLGERFGDVFSVKVGTELAVVLNSYEAIKKAFAQDDLTSRPNTFMFRFFSHGEHGIASASGERWKVQSKFAQSQFKKLGAGKAQMERVVLDEVNDLISELEQSSGKHKISVTVSVTRLSKPQNNYF